ncbi:MAG: hypothetical protein M3R09_02490, partial [Actinomycetota bacterium]|nr:hypothetical protein [Actinomycetota bacterium]
RRADLQPPPSREASHPMSTTTTTLADDHDCTGCGARAGSCDVRRWLAARHRCDRCDHTEEEASHDL